MARPRYPMRQVLIFQHLGIDAFAFSDEITQKDCWFTDDCCIEKDLRTPSFLFTRVTQLASSMLRTNSKAYPDMLESLVIDFKLTYTETLIV